MWEYVGNNVPWSQITSYDRDLYSAPGVKALRPDYRSFLANVLAGQGRPWPAERTLDAAFHLPDGNEKGRSALSGHRDEARRRRPAYDRNRFWADVSLFALEGAGSEEIPPGSTGLHLGVARAKIDTRCHAICRSGLASP